MTDIASTFALRERQALHAESVAGRTVVGGLHWEQLGSSKAAKSLARDRGTRAGFDTACLWISGGVAQAGFGVSSNGARAGTVALATLFARIVGDDGIAAVRLPSGTYGMVAIRDGLILSGSDVCGTADEVQEQFVAQIEQLGDFGHTFAKVLAPAEIYPSADVLDEQTLLGALRTKKVKGAPPFGTIIPLTRSADPGAARRTRVLIALVLIAASAGVGWYLYQSHMDLIHKQQLAAAEARMKALIANQPPPPPPKPWISQPSADALVASCSRELSKLPVAIGGWMLDTATCGAGHMEASYEREGNATVADLLGALQQSLQLTPNIDAAGDKAGLSVGFSAPAASNEALINADDASTAFLSHFQLIDVTAPLTLVPPPSAPPGSTPPPPPPWRIFTWSIQGTPVTAISTASYPSLLLSGLDIPGLRIDTIGLLRTDSAPYLSWTVSGHLYAN